MPASTFQFRPSGGAWTTETQYVSLKIEDQLYFPMSLEVVVANFGTNSFNTRESTYTKYLEVRVLLEGDSNKIGFYGKVESVEPDYDSTYGQIIKITARDNLQEL